MRKKNARAYREALSKLPLLDATDEKAKRRLVEQHFMRVAGYAVASRILSKSLKANDLPPAGKRRFDGSGYFYPAGAPDPRRPRGAYPDTKASTLRYDASVAWRDKMAGRQGEDRPQQARRRPGREDTVMCGSCVADVFSAAGQAEAGRVRPP